MIWRHVLIISVASSAICAAVFWTAGVLGLVLAPHAGLMAYYGALWAAFWGSAALGAVIPFVSVLALWGHFSAKNSN